MKVGSAARGWQILPGTITTRSSRRASITSAASSTPSSRTHCRPGREERDGVSLAWRGIDGGMEEVMMVASTSTAAEEQARARHRNASVLLRGTLVGQEHQTPVLHTDCRPRRRTINMPPLGSRHSASPSSSRSAAACSAAARRAYSACMPARCCSSPAAPHAPKSSAVMACRQAGGRVGGGGAGEGRQRA